MKYVVIVPAGRTGNNIIEHMLSLYLQTVIPELKIFCSDKKFLNCFGISLDKEHEIYKNTNCRKLVIQNGCVNMDEVIQTIKDTPNIKIEITYNLFCKDRYAPMLNIFREIYGNKINVIGFDDRYLVIHIRLEDVATKEQAVHRNYPIVPFSFHRYLLRKTGKLPVFIGQLTDNIITVQLKKSFPTAIFINNAMLNDFECMRRSKNIAISVSTFSFLSAYLSDKNTIVHMPSYGIFNRRDRPDLDYLVVDSRFHYYQFPCIKWTYSDEQIVNIISDKKCEYVEL